MAIVKNKDSVSAAYKTRVTRWAERAIDAGAKREDVSRALAELGLPRLAGRVNVRYKIGQYLCLRSPADQPRETVEADIQRQITGNRQAEYTHYGYDRTGYWELDDAALEYNLDGAWVSPEEYWAAMAAPAVTVESLEEMKVIIRRWVLRLAASTGFCDSGIREVFDALDLGPVPARTVANATVPVTGNVEVNVAAFEGEDPAEVAARLEERRQVIVQELARAGSTYVVQPQIITT